MDEPDLSEEDMRRVLRACRLLHIGTSTPDYLLEFLAQRLEEASSKGLAARVRHFNDRQMEKLRERIRREQDRGVGDQWGAPGP